MASTGQFNVVCSGKLTVELHRSGILGMFRRAVPADCLHFSMSGIQVETPAQLRVGQPVVMDLIVNDLRRYWAFSSVLELVDPTPLVLAREDSIAKLLNAVSAYELGICPTVSRNAVASELDAVLGEACPLLR